MESNGVAEFGHGSRNKTSTTWKRKTLLVYPVNFVLLIFFHSS